MVRGVIGKLVKEVVVIGMEAESQLVMTGEAVDMLAMLSAGDPSLYNLY